MGVTRILVGALVLALSACAPAAPGASVRPTESPPAEQAATQMAATPSPASPSPSQPGGPSATPSPAPTPLAAEFAHGDVVEVVVDGLAVRAEPFESARLVSAWESVDDEWRQVEDEVRLDAGHLVAVQLGPIPIGEIVWYRVREMVQPGQDPTRHWDATGEGPQGESDGWIAVRVGDDPYVRMHEQGGEAPGWMSVLASGNAEFVSDPFPRHDNLHLEWALSLGSRPGPCGFQVTAEGADAATSAGAAVPMVSESLDEPFREGRATFRAADLEPIQGSEQFRLRVAADCDWALTLAALPHD